MDQASLKKLKVLKKLWSSCSNCPLSVLRNKIVFGRGGYEEEIVIVGEAPGPEENESGNPFIGKAGKVLDKLLDIAALERNDTFIMNSVLCYPGRNETGGFNKPREEELIACSPKLKKTLSILRPKYIIALGNSALFALTSKQGIGANRGWQEYVEHNFRSPLYVTYHPSAIGRSETYREFAKEDWIKIGEKLNAKTIKWSNNRAKSLC